MKRVNGSIIVASIASIAAMPLLAMAQATTPTPSTAKPVAPIRAVLETRDVDGAPGKQIVLGTVKMPPGAVAPWHTHPGDEAGYVLSGTLVLKQKGQPDRTLHAGDHFFNPSGMVHELLAGPGDEGGSEVSTWVVEKGKPMATPAAQP
ncbi:dimethylsulfonioproprionate lyase family protein [Pinirhizobacter sp.]|uniref:dimethylsulfonioproprionate lyase family protein n=1 Tax=Pinirhizobacter sp. TaxID=2950432 RepID=UPI002F405ED2